MAGLRDPDRQHGLGGARPEVVAAISGELDAIDRDLAELARLWGGGTITRVEWVAAREALAFRGQQLRNRLGVLSLHAFDAATVPERWDEMGLAGRRAVVTAAFESIVVRRATTRRYDPERITIVWRNDDDDTGPFQG